MRIRKKPPIHVESTPKAQYASGDLQKRQAQAYFFEVTERMTPQELVAACQQRGLPTDDLSVHQLQAQLLAAGS